MNAVRPAAAVLAAAWAALALWVEFRTVRPLGWGAVLAFQGPVHLSAAGFAGHWAGVAASLGWLAVFWAAAARAGALAWDWIGRPRGLAPVEVPPARVLIGFGAYAGLVAGAGLVGLLGVRGLALALLGRWREAAAAFARAEALNPAEPMYQTERLACEEAARTGFHPPVQLDISRTPPAGSARHGGAAV